MSHDVFSRSSRRMIPRRPALPLRYTAAALIAAMSILTACNRSETPQEAPATARVPDTLQWTNFSTGANVKTLAFEGPQLWMGMPSGVIRYDTLTPDSHEIFTSTSTQGGLMSRGIYVIRVDPDGNKWIGTYGGGLTRFDGKEWKTYTVQDGLADQWVYDIVWDRQGKMWVATWDGVSLFDGQTFKSYRVADGLADKWVYSIALDQDGIFWFGTEAGVSRFDPKATGRGAWTTFTHNDGLGAEIGSPSQESPAGEAPAAPAPAGPGGDYPDEGSSEYGAEGLRHHMDPTKANVGANPNFVVAAAVDRTNGKWFGTWGAGLSRFDGRSWKTYTAEEGLGGNFIHAIALDAEGRIWVGTNGGVSWFDGNKWSNLSEREGLLNNNVFSVAFDNEGRRWFGTWEGLSMHKGPLPPSSTR